jgi:hypothetical protein
MHCFLSLEAARIAAPETGSGQMSLPRRNG